jgi:hypothetical protein
MLITLSLITSLTLTAPSQKELEKIITGVHTKTFSVTNLYKAPLDAEDWNNVITLTQDFVEQKRDEVVELGDTNQKSKISQTFSSTIQRNKKLMQHYDKIKQANNDLIKTIKAAYADLFEPEKQKNAKSMEKFSKKFSAINTNMGTLATHLKEELKMLTDKIKAEKSDTKKEILQKQESALTVLHRLALTLKTTAVKARNDLRK